MPPFASSVSMATGLNLATHCMLRSWSAETRVTKAVKATRAARKREKNEVIVSEKPNVRGCRFSAAGSSAEIRSPCPTSVLLLLVTIILNDESSYNLVFQQQDIYQQITILTIISHTTHAYAVRQTFCE